MARGSVAQEAAQEATGSTCEVGDCTRVARRSGRCWAHIKQAQLKKPLMAVRERPRSAWEGLTEAFQVYCDKELISEDEFRKAKDRARKAAIAYANSLGRLELLALVAAPRRRPRRGALQLELGFSPHTH